MLKKSVFVFAIIIGLKVLNADAQQVSIIKFNQLQNLMQQKNDTTYVFNFWATWCDPCVKEFPNFQKLSNNFANKKLKIVFISLDFKKNFETALLPFLKKHAVKNDVYLLNETDYDSWINKVDSLWNGNLPATLVINHQKHIHQLFAQDFTYEELEKMITKFIY